MDVAIRKSCTGKEIFIFINKSKELQNRSHKEITQLTSLKVKRNQMKYVLLTNGTEAVGYC